MILGFDPGADAWYRCGFSESSRYEPIGRGVQGAGLGNGYTDAEVDAIPYRAEWLWRYHECLMSERPRTSELRTDPSFSVKIVVPRRPKPTTPAACLEHVLRHGTNHVTEIRGARRRIEGPSPAARPQAN